MTRSKPAGTGRRLTYEERRGAAQTPFVAALFRYDFSAFAEKMEAGFI
ncbi:hypothetical protein [Deinococcus sp. Leaf326]|nr:hypothetical protein [Deinococcus sp. Leaf326]